MDLEEEIKILESRFSEAPDSRLFLPLADALSRAGELERAAKLCREGLEKFPDFKSARVLLARCQSEMGELEEAQKTFEEIKADDGGNIEAFKGLASLAGLRGDTGRAFAYYQEARRIDRTDEQVARALEALEKEKETRAPSVDDRTSRPGREEETITVHADSGTAAPALDQEEAPGPPEPGEIFLTHTLADIYRLQGHFDRAYKIYRELLARSGEDQSLRRKLDEVSSHLGEKTPPSAAGEAAETGSGETGPPGIGEPPGDMLPAREELLDIALVQEPPPEPDAVSVEAGDRMVPSIDKFDRLEKRIDSIFGLLLGEKVSPEKEIPDSEESIPAESGEFVGMLEVWLSGLKEKELR
ncbi:MAG TPA: tetratricopeptide repeat protein [archaeon]|nr:tetratricopeptide repeat protein [archaeon]